MSDVNPLRFNELSSLFECIKYEDPSSSIDSFTSLHLSQGNFSFRTSVMHAFAYLICPVSSRPSISLHHLASSQRLIPIHQLTHVEFLI